MGVCFSDWAWRRRASRIVGHAGEPKLAERVIEFDEIHVGSPVCRSMRSR